MKSTLIFTAVLAFVASDMHQTKSGYKPKSSSKPSGSYGGKGPSDSQYCELVNGTNDVRAQNGKAALTADSRLDASAAQECSEMLQSGELEHEIYSTMGDRITNAGYNWSGAAENIYDENGYGNEDYNRALQGWIKSPGHFANMIGDYTAVGHAYCTDGNTGYWAQDFACGDDEPQYQYACDGSAPTYQNQEPTESYQNQEPTESYQNYQPQPTENYQPQPTENYQPEQDYQPEQGYQPQPTSDELDLNETRPEGYGYQAQPTSDELDLNTYKPEGYKTRPTESAKPIKYGKHGKPCKKTSYGKKSKSYAKKGERYHHGHHDHHDKHQ